MDILVLKSYSGFERKMKELKKNNKREATDSDI